MYICTGCKSVSEKMDDLEHDPVCSGGAFMTFSAYLRHEEDSRRKLEQKVASINTDLSLAAELLRKYTRP